MAWLQQGLADGTLPVNVAGALVHFVPEGMLLVSVSYTHLTLPTSDLV